MQEPATSDRAAVANLAKAIRMTANQRAVHVIVKGIVRGAGAVDGHATENKKATSCNVTDTRAIAQVASALLKAVPSGASDGRIGVVGSQASN